MPSDIAHFKEFAGRSHHFRDNTAVQLSENSSACDSGLPEHGGSPAVQNGQSSADMAGLPTGASSVISGLTPRQQQVMALVLEGHPSKNIAADLNISQRTVENHRAAIMRRTGATSLPALVRLSLGLA